jgi:hypothetical protein
MQPLVFVPCSSCSGRPLCVTVPVRGANRYKVSSRKVKRSMRAKVHATGGAFTQRCIVCGGTGTLLAPASAFRDVAVAT